MDKTYNPQSIEKQWYETWEKNQYFSPRGTGTPYCIMIPPPNVTGNLHMGHAFQDTLMDALIRYHRMKGDNTLWQVGTDHAGIATQMVVERQLAAQGKTRHDLGREAFVNEIWKWKQESGGHITRQLRRMGASVDWSRERFTLDEGLSKAVTEVFVRLYEEGLIYRGKRLVNWDPVLRTAVSDLEVISQEEDGYLWHIRYPLADGSAHMTVATTRPETMLGDTAVAVHPEDERYKKLIGKKVKLPLTGRDITIIADEYVDPIFGSGCVKITPAHDFNDYEVGKRHDLPLINIFTADARIDLPGSDYHGLDRYEARKQIVANLEVLNLIAEIKPHKLMVPRGDRTHAVIEPYLTDQWYVKIAPLTADAIKAVEDGHIRFVPENWSKTYFEWMRNIQDWCISRQIWWGHRIPAWYDDAGNIHVARNLEEAQKKAGGKSLRQDEDVLDTWFSSALWPFSTLGWPDETLVAPGIVPPATLVEPFAIALPCTSVAPGVVPPATLVHPCTSELKTFYPTSVLVTGFDIIFFWVARMIMMGLKFTGKVPFHEVYIHGLVRDAEGQKMSKSKGNVLDPIDLIDGISLEGLIAKRTTGLMQPEMAQKIEQVTRKHFPDGIPAYGTDALRFTFASLATQGRDIKFDTGRIEGYRHFCNKLWNAARYVLMNTEGHDCGIHSGGENPPDAPSETLRPLPPSGNREVTLSLADRWIISRLQLAEQQVIEAIHNYRFDLASQAIYEFTWNEYCDWYLEFSKTILTSDAQGRALAKGSASVAGGRTPGATEKSSTASLRGTRRTLVRVLETLLRLAHPLMPFITEEIWQRVAPLAGKDGATIMLQPYPVPQLGKVDQTAVAEMSWVMNFILGVRSIRSGMAIAPAKPLPVLLQNGSEQDRAWLDNNHPYLTTLARLESITWLESDRDPPESATALVGAMKVLIPLAGLIDKQAELTRLGKEIEKVRKDLSRSESKLANPDYVNRAPAAVVAEERQRIADFSTALQKLTEQQTRMQGL